MFVQSQTLGIDYRRSISGAVSWLRSPSESRLHALLKYKVLQSVGFIFRYCSESRLALGISLMEQCAAWDCVWNCMKCVNLQDEQGSRDAIVADHTISRHRRSLLTFHCCAHLKYVRQIARVVLSAEISFSHTLDHEVVSKNLASTKSQFWCSSWCPLRRAFLREF